MPSQNHEIASAATHWHAFLDVDAAKLEEKMAKKEYMVKLAPEGKNITKEQADEIARLQIDGLYTGVDFARHYPNGELFKIDWFYGI